MRGPWLLATASAVASRALDEGKEEEEDRTFFWLVLAALAAAAWGYLCFRKVPCRLLGVGDKAQEQGPFTDLEAVGAAGAGAKAPRRSTARSRWSNPRCIEVSFVTADQHEERRIVHAASDGVDEFCILQVKKCQRGPPLLPDASEIGWRAQTDEEARQFTLKGYVETLLATVPGAPPANFKVHLGGQFLKERYQVALPNAEWYAVWTALQTPWVKQRSAYRRLLGGKNAPDLLFGCQPRFLELDLKGDASEVATTVGSDGHRTPDARSHSSPLSDKDPAELEGLPLEDWASPWQGIMDQVPEKRTFIHFAESVGETSRIRSASASR